MRLGAFSHRDLVYDETEFAGVSFHQEYLVSSQHDDRIITRQFQRPFESSIHITRCDLRSALQNLDGDAFWREASEADGGRTPAAVDLRFATSPPCSLARVELREIPTAQQHRLRILGGQHCRLHSRLGHPDCEYALEAG